MSSALKQVIINAIVKVAGHNPARDMEGEPTAEQARDDFIRLLIAELFPENSSVPAIKEKKKPGPKPKLDENGNPIRKQRSPKSAEPSPDSLAEPSPPKERKPRSPMTEEQKAAMVAKRKATLEAKKAAEPAPEAPEPEAEPEKKERKKPAPKTEEEKAAIAAKRKATMEAKKAAGADAPPSPEKTPKKADVPPVLPASPPKAPKKAKKETEPKESPKKAKKAAEPAPSTSANLDKFTPTQKKKLVEIAGEAVDKKDVLAYLNGLSNAAFHDKKLEDHFRDYVASLAKPETEPEQEEVDLVEQEFDGETYYVNPETKRVYTMDEHGNTTPVGYVGMAKFADMELDEEEDDE